MRKFGPDLDEASTAMYRQVSNGEKLIQKRDFRRRVRSIPIVGRRLVLWLERRAYRRWLKKARYAWLPEDWTWED